MRVLITTTRGAGHFGPLVPFARAIFRLGGDVLVAVAQPGVPMVQEAGFEAWPLALPGSETERRAFVGAAMQLPPDEGNARVLRDMFLRVDARAALPGVRDAVAAFRPQLVLHESAEFAGPLVAERVGLPSVSVDITLASFAARFEHAMVTGVRELRAGLGLPARAAVAELRERRFSLLPAALEDGEAGVAPVQRFRARSARIPPLPDWWDGDERPLVYLTLGSVVPGTPFFPGLYRAAIDELASLDLRVLVTIGGADRAALGELPPSVHVERWVAQDDVLPHAAAVVCHGGAGTVTGALAAGVPLAVLPLFADQPFNAGRVAAAGAGIALEGGPPAVAGLRAAVGRLLADGAYRAAAEGIARELGALPTVDTAAALLGRLAAEAA